MFRQPKRVRIHELSPDLTVEGILVRKTREWLVIQQVGVLQSEDRTVPLTAREVWVPREKVVMVEVLTS